MHALRPPPCHHGPLAREKALMSAILLGRPLRALLRRTDTGEELRAGAFQVNESGEEARQEHRIMNDRHRCSLPDARGPKKEGSLNQTRSYPPGSSTMPPQSLTTLRSGCRNSAKWRETTRQTTPVRGSPECSLPVVERPRMTRKAARKEYRVNEWETKSCLCRGRRVNNTRQTRGDGATYKAQYSGLTLPLPLFMSTTM